MARAWRPGAVRRALVLAHRGFGLIGAIWLLSIGLTGSVLVFHEEIDALLNPAFHRAESPSARPAPLDRLVGSAAGRHPGSYVRYLDLPDHPAEPVRAFLSERLDAPGALPDRVEVALDPTTGRVQAERVRGRPELGRAGLVPFLYTFHYSLHLGPTASWALGLLALVWILDHALALALSFPGRRAWWRSFGVRRRARGHRLVFDLHRATGLWLLPVTLVLASTGLYFNWFDSVRTWIDAVAPLSERYDQRAPALRSPQHTPAIGFGRAVEQVRAYAGTDRIDGISYDPRKGLYWASVFDPRDPGHRGDRWVFVDAASGRVVSDGHRASGSVGDRIVAWQLPLHSGRAFGWSGRIGVLLAGVGLCGLVVTGVLIWARKHRARRHGVSRVGDRPPVSGSPGRIAAMARVRGGAGVGADPPGPVPSRPAR